MSTDQPRQGLRSAPSGGRALGRFTGLAVLGGALAGGYYLMVLGGWAVCKAAGWEPWLLRVQHDWISGFSFLAFGVATGLLWGRRRQLRREAEAFALPQLGSDEEALLLPEDALACRKQLSQLPEETRALMVVRLVQAGLQRARGHWSATDVGEAIKTQAEILREESGAVFAVVRYLAWAIPTLGFIGTVLGVGQAIGALKGTSDAVSNPLEAAAANLHTAFDTTLVALFLSLVLMYLLHRSEAAEDGFVAQALQWCMQRLVLRMYVPQEPRG